MSDLQRLFGLTGKIALITGGSRGLGLQIAEALGGQGAHVVLAARDTDGLREAEARLAELGVHASRIVTDMTSDSDIDRLADEVIATHGGVDILVNNAGVARGAPAEDHSTQA